MARVSRPVLQSVNDLRDGSGAPLAQNRNVTVLLLEAGGSGDCPSALESGLWLANVGGERVRAFQAEPNPNVNGRVLPMSMGKVPGGCSLQ
jgi:choline dehydrogenase